MFELITKLCEVMVRVFVAGSIFLWIAVPVMLITWDIKEGKKND